MLFQQTDVIGFLKTFDEPSPRKKQLDTGPIVNFTLADIELRNLLFVIISIMLCMTTKQVLTSIFLMLNFTVTIQLMWFYLDK